MIANYGKAWEDVKNGVKNTLSELENLLVFLQQHPELWSAMTQRDLVGVINSDDNLGAGGDTPGGTTGQSSPGFPVPDAQSGPPVNVTVNATVSNDVDIEQLAYRVAEVIQRKNPQ